MNPIQHLKVLIVEDSNELAQLMQIMLRDMGIQSEYVHTGHGALDFLTRQMPDLMILDIGLPEMSGWQVLDQAELRQHKVAFPVIVLTAHDDPMNRLIGKMHKPVVRYLFKPFRISALSSAVRDVLNLAEQ
ncbi:MAG: response regulator [Chloroflexota bacterium]|nr:response regulator [Chloroflexota bacterium]